MYLDGNMQGKGTDKPYDPQTCFQLVLGAIEVDIIKYIQHTHNGVY